MKRLIFACAGVSAMLLMPPVFAQVELEPVGMKVIWKSLDKEFDGFKVYNSDAGVHVTLAATSKGGKFIGFEKDGSKVEFLDGENKLGGKFGFFSKISKSGDVMKVEMQSGKLPAGGTVKIEGELKMLTANASKTFSVGPRELKKGDKVELTEGFVFKVSELGKPKWGDDPLQISLQWKRKEAGKVPELKAVRFYTEDGALIESTDGGSSWGGFLGSYTTTKTYRLKKAAKILKIEMDIWQDMKKITVSLDIDLKVGKP